MPVYSKCMKNSTSTKKSSMKYFKIMMLIFSELAKEVELGGEVYIIYPDKSIKHFNLDNFERTK